MKELYESIKQMKINIESRRKDTMTKLGCLLAYSDNMQSEDIIEQKNNIKWYDAQQNAIEQVLYEIEYRMK
jgi:hypothetical protein